MYVQFEISTSIVCQIWAHVNWCQLGCVLGSGQQSDINDWGNYRCHVETLHKLLATGDVHANASVVSQISGLVGMFAGKVLVVINIIFHDECDPFNDWLRLYSIRSCLWLFCNCPDSFNLFHHCARFFLVFGCYRSRVYADIIVSSISSFVFVSRCATPNGLRAAAPASASAEIQSRTGRAIGSVRKVAEREDFPTLCIAQVAHRV